MLDIEFTVEEGKLYILQSSVASALDSPPCGAPSRCGEGSSILPPPWSGSSRAADPAPRTIFEPAAKQRRWRKEAPGPGLNAGPGSLGKVALSANAWWRWPGKGEGPPGPGGNVSRGYRGNAAAEGFLTAGGHDLLRRASPAGWEDLWSAAPISWWTRSGASSGPGHGDRRGEPLIHRRTRER